MGPFYEMIANVYAQGWVELLLTRFQWIFFFADALDSLCLAQSKYPVLHFNSKGIFGGKTFLFLGHLDSWAST